MKRLSSKVFILPILLCVFVAVANGQVNVLISYYTQTGHTKEMAEAVAKGAASVEGTTVKVKSMEETTDEDLKWANALIIGCPVHMSNIPHQAIATIMKWSGRNLRNKIGATFVTSGYMSTGEEVVHINLMLNMLMKRMIIVGGPDHSQSYGATAVTMEEPFKSMNPKGVAEQFIAKGKALGQRVAEIAGLMKK